MSKRRESPPAIPEPGDAPVIPVSAVILLAALLYQPGPSEGTAMAYGVAVTVLALVLVRPRRVWR